MCDNMDPNKFYCRNAPQQILLTKSISQSPSIKKSYNVDDSQEYNNCLTNHSSGGFNCKEIFSRNTNSKATVNNRGTSGILLAECNANEYCSTNSTGNYINVMPIPIGTLQYNRRKLTTQEYPSRLFYNTTDNKCRDEYYTSINSGRYSNGSPTAKEQLQTQQNNFPQQFSQSLSFQQQQQFSQQSQHHNQNQTIHSHHQMNSGTQHSHQLPHHHQPLCSSSTVIDAIDDNVKCALFQNHTARIGSSENHHATNGSNIHDQGITSSIEIAQSNGAVPPIMFAVHRVVTTAQIQTGVGGTFASSSSVSSVISTSRNDTECVAATSVSESIADSAKSTCLLANNGNILSETTNNVVNNSIAVLAGPGVSTNAGFLPHQEKSENILSAQSNFAQTKENCATLLGSIPVKSHVNGEKGSLVTRPLQNVIPTCVYLMSRIAVHMEIEGTAQCPSQVMLAAALGCEELGIANKLLAQSIFGLWMTSALLELQLKAHHSPYITRVAWSNLLDKFSHGNLIDKKFDEPMIVLKRNVFFSKRDEEKIKDHRILELLYEEAKYNVLTGRYVMESVHSLMLGGIQARIELGPYNSHTHTIGFFRENQTRFLPSHVAKSSSWSWLPVSRKNSAEVKLLEQFKRVPQTATTRKLMRKYLEFCWALPFYGAAFFHGQVEQPVRGLISLVNHKDVDVLVAVNEKGVFIIDPFECTLILGLRYEDLSWDYAKPSVNEDPDCQTCIFIQFDAIENGIQISKLIQIFSKQAVMIDALINHFTEQMKRKKLDGNVLEHDEPYPIQNNGNGVLCNKLSRLTLATFDEEGRCIGQMGSLSISY